MGVLARLRGFFTKKGDTLEERMIKRLAEYSSYNRERFEELENKINALSKELKAHQQEEHVETEMLRSLHEDIKACSRVVLGHEERLKEIEKVRKAVAGDEGISRPEREIEDEEVPQRLSGIPTQKVLKNLTSSEKAVLNVLLNAEFPLSYGEIAQRINKKIVTAKAHMNSLKKKGIPLEETKTGKKKRYSLAESFKIGMMRGV